MTNCLILADDLAGAADSAVSALHAGLDAEVFLTADGAEQSRTAVAAIDLNTREIEVERARTLTFKSLEKIHPRSDLFLYRRSTRRCVAMSEWNSLQPGRLLASDSFSSLRLFQRTGGLLSGERFWSTDNRMSRPNSGTPGSPDMTWLPRWRR
jgi:hypothetical protein